jgi:hypothetical protein
LEYWFAFWWVFDCPGDLYRGLHSRNQWGGAVRAVFRLAFPALGIPLAPVQAVQVGLFTEIFGFASSTSAFWRSGLIDFRLAGGTCWR